RVTEAGILQTPVDAAYISRRDHQVLRHLSLDFDVPLMGVSSLAIGIVEPAALVPRTWLRKHAGEVPLDLLQRLRRITKLVSRARKPRAVGPLYFRVILSYLGHGWKRIEIQSIPGPQHEFRCEVPRHAAAGAPIVIGRRDDESRLSQLDVLIEWHI